MRMRLFVVVVLAAGSGVAQAGPMEAEYRRLVERWPYREGLPAGDPCRRPHFEHERGSLSEIVRDFQAWDRSFGPIGDRRSAYCRGEVAPGVEAQVVDDGGAAALEAHRLATERLAGGLGDVSFDGAASALDAVPAPVSIAMLTPEPIRPVPLTVTEADDSLGRPQVTEVSWSRTPEPLRDAVGGGPISLGSRSYVSYVPGRMLALLEPDPETYVVSPGVNAGRPDLIQGLREAALDVRQEFEGMRASGEIVPRMVYSYISPVEGRSSHIGHDERTGARSVDILYFAVDAETEEPVELTEAVQFNLDASGRSQRGPTHSYLYARAGGRLVKFDMERNARAMYSLTRTRHFQVENILLAEHLRGAMLAWLAADPARADMRAALRDVLDVAYDPRTRYYRSRTLGAVLNRTLHDDHYHVDITARPTRSLFQTASVDDGPYAGLY